MIHERSSSRNEVDQVRVCFSYSQPSPLQTHTVYRDSTTFEILVMSVEARFKVP